MPYILNKTNGTIVAVVDDASLDLTTDLTFLGRNYAGYGEVQNENFLKLLENFSNTIAPEKPIEGQLWFDSLNKKLNVYDNLYWKTIANLEIADEDNDPKSFKSPSRGDLWYNTSKGQLNVFNGSDFVVVGPPIGDDTRAQWRGDHEFSSETLSLPIFNVKAVIGANDEVVAVVSAESYTMPDYSLTDTNNPPTYPIRTSNFTEIKKGISLVGVVTATNAQGLVYASTRKELTGLESDSYFWGTAGEAIHALSANTASFASGLAWTTASTNAQFFVPFLNTTSNTSTVLVDNGIKYNPSTNVLFTIASSALYADLAERYEADNVYEPGTVLMHGGEKEVTLANNRATTAVAGVVSKNPAYRMNSEAGTDDTHPYIALKGRIPCKVCGPVKKGDLLVSSGYKLGYATKKEDHDSPNAVIGKALENFEGPFGIIEIKV